MLKIYGVFIQWQWLKNDEKSDIGLSEKTIKNAFIQNEFKTIKIKYRFTIKGAKGSMTVIMAISTC